MEPTYGLFFRYNWRKAVLNHAFPCPDIVRIF